jgi:hypothetical protein
MERKTLLKRLNSNFHCGSRNFSFENEKYDFSQLPLLLKQIRKVGGYSFKLGIVSAESSESSEEKSDSSNENESESSEEKSDSSNENETSSDTDSGAKETIIQKGDNSCSKCSYNFSTRFNLIRHIKRMHS